MNFNNDNNTQDPYRYDAGGLTDLDHNQGYRELSAFYIGPRRVLPMFLDNWYLDAVKNRRESL